MARKGREIEENVRLRQSSTALDKDGQIKYDSDDKFTVRENGTDRELVTDTDTQTLENKTIDATAASGNNTLSADAGDIVYVPKSFISDLATFLSLMQQSLYSYVLLKR